MEVQDEDDMEDGGTDDFVWLPYTTATSLAKSANINSYTFTVSDTDNAEEAKTCLKVSFMISLRMMTFTE